MDTGHCKLGTISYNLTLNVIHWTLDISHWTLDVINWAMDIIYWTLDFRCWALDIVYWKLDIRHCTVFAVYWTLDMVHRIMDNERLFRGGRGAKMTFHSEVLFKIRNLPSNARGSL